MTNIERGIIEEESFPLHYAKVLLMSAEEKARFIALGKAEKED